MSHPRKRALIFVLAGLALAWLGLFLSSKALLIWGNGPDNDAKLGALRCTYFTGTGFTERKFLYSESGVLGRETCPRWIDL